MIEWQVNNATSSFKNAVFLKQTAIYLRLKNMAGGFFFFFLVTLFFTFRHLSHKEKCTKRDLL